MVGVISAGILGLIFVMCIGSATYFAYIQPDFQYLEFEGNGLVDQIETFHEQHGRYPFSADEAGLTLPETRWGRWKYLTRDKGNSFELTIGEYQGLDPFELYWTSENEYWYRDT